MSEFSHAGAIFAICQALAIRGEFMRSSFKKLAVMAVGLASVNVASAAMQFNSRFSEFDIVLSDMQFTSGTVHYSTTFGVIGNAGDALNGAVVPLKSLATNASITTTGGVSVNGLVINPGVSANFNMLTDGTAGTITGANDTPIGTAFCQSFLIRGGLVGGLPTLNFFSGDGLSVAGIMAPGSVYDLDVKINGDWTNAGTSAGNILGTALNFAGGWTFGWPPEFDGTETTIHFHNGSYDGTNGPGLQFTLFGAPASVPEPSPIALLVAAFAMFGAHRRRRMR